MSATVYFTREITPEKVIELYHKLGYDLPGKVAVKVHTGEKGNQNFIRPTFWKPMLELKTTLPMAMRSKVFATIPKATERFLSTMAGPKYSRSTSWTRKAPMLSGTSRTAKS